MKGVHMKSVSLSEFAETMPAVMAAVSETGKIVRVDGFRSGSVVLLEEHEYSVLRDSLRLCFTAAGSVDEATGTVGVADILQKLTVTT